MQLTLVERLLLERLKVTTCDVQACSPIQGSLVQIASVSGLYLNSGLAVNADVSVMAVASYSENRIELYSLPDGILTRTLKGYVHSCHGQCGVGHRSLFTCLALVFVDSACFQADSQHLQEHVLPK